jgi:nucleoside-diphosphate-sugar epimerase
MPTVQPPAKVLVSGATGYIAVWVVQNLLDRGYAVRGTARSVAKGDFLKKVFASYASGDRFEVVIVVDIAEVSFKLSEARRSFMAFCGLLVRMGHSTRQSKAWMPSNTQRHLSTSMQSILMVSRQEALEHPTN